MLFTMMKVYYLFWENLMKFNRPYIGQVIDGKKIVEIHRNFASTEFYVIFNDKSWKVMK